MQSDRIDIREQAQAYLISKLMENRIMNRPRKCWIRFQKEGARQRTASGKFVHCAGRVRKAAKLTEEKLLSATTEIHGALMTLMEIALKEKRMEDAEYIADIDKQAAQVFDLWEYNSYGAQFQLYVATKKERRR